MSKFLLENIKKLNPNPSSFIDLLHNAETKLGCFAYLVGKIESILDDNFNKNYDVKYDYKKELTELYKEMNQILDGGK